MAKQTLISKTWKYNTNFTAAKKIREALYVLRKNVEKDIQFDHNSFSIMTGFSKPYELAELLSSPGVMRTLLLKLIDGIPLEDTVEYFVDETIRANKLVSRISDLSKGLTAVNRVNNVDTLQRLFNQAVSSYTSRAVSTDSLKHIELAAKQKPLMIIPKNSDKASLDRRNFIAKTQLAELLLTSIALNNAEIPSVINQDSTAVEYYPFGARVITRDNGTQLYSNYIAEYNMYRATIAKHAHAGDLKFFKAFDISKFFANINTEKLAHMLAKDTFENNQNRRISMNQYETMINSLLSFKYFETDSVTGERVEHTAKGLTIESHTQHVLANYFLTKVVEEAFTYGLGKAAEEKVVVCSYVDDFVILGKTKEDVSAVYFTILEKLNVYGLDIAEDKTTETLSTQDDFQTLKELVRLPSRTYFDMTTEELEGDRNTNYQELIPYNSMSRVTIGNKFQDQATKFLKEFESQGGILNHVLINNTKLKSHYSSTPIHQLMRVLATPGYETLSFEVKEFIITNIAFATTVEERKTERLLGNNSWHLRESDAKAFTSFLIKRSYSRNGEIDTAELSRIIQRIFHTKDIFKLFDAGLSFNEAVLTNTSLQAMMMRAFDSAWLLENYSDFREYDQAKAEQLLKDIADENILETLQYFYVTLNRPTAYSLRQQEEIYNTLLNLNAIIISKYPSKIRFVSAINKLFIRRQYSGVVVMQGDANSNYKEHRALVQETYDKELAKFAGSVYDRVNFFYTFDEADKDNCISVRESIQHVSDTAYAQNKDLPLVHAIAKLSFSGIVFHDSHAIANSMVYFMYRMFNRNNVVKYSVV